MKQGDVEEGVVISSSWNIRSEGGQVVESTPRETKAIEIHEQQPSVVNGLKAKCSWTF